MIRRILVYATGLLAGVALVVACSSEPRAIVLASTTSTEDSGLFDALLPAFERAQPRWRVRVIAVGSGEALRLGARGDADVLLTHSPAAEARFMAEGHGVVQRRVMYNDFVIVGPPDGPGSACAGHDALSAMRCLAHVGAPFLSRGDESGTHSKERELWEAAGVEPTGEWYLEAGTGMGSLLMMASEKAAYTLTDRGTYLSLRDRLQLDVLVEGDSLLHNPYAVTQVADAANPEGAGAFVEWITSPAAQQLIGRFGMERYGRPLFTPDAGGR